MNLNSNIDEIISALTPIVIAVSACITSTAISVTAMNSNRLDDNVRNVIATAGIGIAVTGLGSAGSLASPNSINRSRQRQQEEHEN